MTDQEITEFVNLVEQTWLENFVAKDYLKKNCGIADPEKFLLEKVKTIPEHALAYQIFAPVKKAIGRGLQDSEFFEEFRKAFLQLSKL